MALPLSLPLLAAVFLCYRLLLVVYRLCFHPLAQFPGPKLAAVSGLYEAYFDFFLRPGGFYNHEIRRLHRVYGPIIRINPHEIHIHDPTWADSLYINPAQGIRDKYKPNSDLTGTPDAVFGTVGHEVHRRRRAAISSHFSKASVAGSVPMIYDKIDLLFRRMEDQIAQRGCAEMRVNFFSLTTDTVSEHSLSWSTDLLRDEDAALRTHETIKSLARIMPLARQFSSVVPFAMLVPVKLVEFVLPGLARIVKLHRAMGVQARKAVAAYHNTKPTETLLSAGEDTSLPTGNMFHSIISSRVLRPEDKSLDRMCQEGIVLFTAGGETTGRTLATATYHVLANRDTILPRLQQELIGAIPDPQARVALSDLERLPLLTAIIKESLRISAVITGRLPVVSPNKPLKYRDWVIPSGTPVSMTLHDVLLDPEIFDEPMEFRPDRWLASNPDLAQISPYFLPFGRGSRMCLGMSLAWAQIYIALAYLFRRYDLELHDTLRERDLDIVRDCFLGEVRHDTKGIRVKFHTTKDSPEDSQ